MSTTGQQGSGRDRQKSKVLQGEPAPQVPAGGSGDNSTATESAPSRPDRSPGVRRFFRRRGVGDVYRLNGTDYRLEKPVGSGTGEAKGKSEAWRATELGLNQREVFLKLFQSPKFPNEDERNDAELGPDLLRRCERFEARHREVGRRLTRERTGTGSLIKPLDFGRPADSLSYMKVYPWVPDAMTITLEGVLDWTRSERLVFLRTLLLAVWELHELQIAHGDIKKENILIAQLPVGPVARLIDFDEAFLADTPPLSLEETEVGTTLMAPEWKVLENPVRAAGLTGITLGTRTDLFQLAVVLEGVFGSGVITWNTSQLGNLNDHADYSLAGATPNCSDLGLSLPRVAQLMRDCLNRQSSRRPSIETLLSTLGVSSP